MKIEYDPKHDIMNIEFISDEPIIDSIEMEGIIIDYTKDKKIVSIEILDAGKRISKNPFDLLDIKILREKAVA